MLYGGHMQDAETIGDLRRAADEASPGPLPGEHYPVAARFVAFLLETRGLEPFKNVCEIPVEDAETLDAAFVRVYGSSLDELLGEFEAYPAWTLGELRQDQACEGDDIVASPGAWTMSFDCGAPGVEGRLGEQVVTQRLIELPQDGAYTFEFNAKVDSFLRLELRNCIREGLASIHYQTEYVYPKAGTPKELLLFDLPAGVYVVRVMVEDYEAPVAVDMSVTPWP